MAESLLDLPAKRGRLHALAAAGVLGREQLGAALEAVGLRPSSKSWSAYLYWHALLVGVVLLAAGVIFFVAANWSALHGFARMAIVGGAMVLATLIGGFLGDTLAGRASSLLGGLLFGPLLAVYGQIYQTGADAWELFAAWAVVLVATGALVRFVGTWVLALLCLHVAFFAFLDQELGVEFYSSRGALFVAGMAVFDGLVVVVTEASAAHTRGRVRAVMTQTAAFMGLALVLPFGVLTVVGELPEGGLLGLAVLVAGLVGIWAVYRWRRPEIGMLAAFAGVITILVTSFLGRILLEAELFGVALLGLLVCAQVWGFVRWLLAWRREHPKAAAESTGGAEAEPEQGEGGAGRSGAELSLAQVFAGLAPRPRAEVLGPQIDEALHDEEGRDAPVFVRLFSAGGTWVGAAMITMIFFAFEIYEWVFLALVLAVGLFGGAIVLSRRPQRSLVRTQLIWAMALGAQALVGGALLEAGVSEGPMALIWMLINLGALFLIRVPSFQLVSAVFAVGFGTWLCHSLELPMFGLWAALPAAAVAAAVWIFETPISARLGRTWSALAYGLPVGAAVPLTLAGISEELVVETWGATAATASVLVIIGVVSWRAKGELEGALEGRAYVLGAVALVAVLAARHVPGLSLALLWLLVAHLRRSPTLQAIACVQMAGFLFFFYYQLETTLLLKSLWVLSTGAVLLIGAVFARPQGEPGQDEKQGRAPRWGAAFALVALCSVVVAVPTALKERTLAAGQAVLLPLAPVDPRSLMQGDYMALNYAMEEELAEALGTSVGEAVASGELPRHGELVIAVDADGVGHFARLPEAGEDLSAKELLLEYRVRDDWGDNLRVGADAFFFEEGRAEDYADAGYGEVIVADSGESILIGLRGRERQPLGDRLHPR